MTRLECLLLILIKFALCRSEAFVIPRVRIQNMMDNTVQENTETKLATIIDNQIVVGIGQNLICAEEFNFSQLIVHQQTKTIVIKI